MKNFFHYENQLLMAYNKTDGEKLHRYLVVNEISKKDFSQKLKIGETTLYRWFKEENFQDDKIQQLRGAGITIDDILKGSAAPMMANESKEIEFYRRENELLRQIAKSLQDQIELLKQK